MEQSMAQSLAAGKCCVLCRSPTAFPASQPRAASAREPCCPPVWLPGSRAGSSGVLLSPLPPSPTHKLARCKTSFGKRRWWAGRVVWGRHDQPPCLSKRGRQAEGGVPSPRSPLVKPPRGSLVCWKASGYWSESSKGPPSCLGARAHGECGEAGRAGALQPGEVSGLMLSSTP